jgi:hypothetical protein
MRDKSGTNSVCVPNSRGEARIRDGMGTLVAAIKYVLALVRIQSCFEQPEAGSRRNDSGARSAVPRYPPPFDPKMGIFTNSDKQNQI